MADKIPEHVTMEPVESSQIKAIGHDPQANHLYVEFHGRTGKQRPVYRYANFPSEQHAALMGAESKGKHFGATVKSNPAHPFQKLDLGDVVA